MIPASVGPMQNFAFAPCFLFFSVTSLNLLFWESLRCVYGSIVISVAFVTDVNHQPCGLALLNLFDRCPRLPCRRLHRDGHVSVLRHDDRGAENAGGSDLQGDSPAGR